MTGFDQLWNRLGLILAIVEKSEGGNIGRTAAMKYFYLLQTCKNVPLNYNFRLYYYGPFDSEVLSDLDYARSLAAVTSDVSYLTSGCRYKLSRGEKAQSILNKAGSFIKNHEDQID